MRYRPFALGFFVFLLLSIVCRDDHLLGMDKDSLPFDIESWMQGPERKDFSCKVKIYKPVLTFQQRQLVRIQTIIEPGSLDSDIHQYDFHVVIKIASGDKDWAPGYSYTHIPVDLDTNESDKIDAFNGFYLKPGRYTFEILVYDAIHKKGSMLRKKKVVPRLTGALLPGMDQDLPEIEFVDGGPRSQMTGDNDYILEPGWPMSLSREWIPVENNRCLCIEIIAYTANDYYYQRPYPFDGHYDSSDMQRMKSIVENEHIMEIASVLSHLNPRKGQIRVSVLSTDRMETVFYRENANGFNWPHASDAVAEIDLNTIDVDRLQRVRTPYLSDISHRIIKEGDCSCEEQQPVKIAIIVARNLFSFYKAENVDSLVPNNTDTLHIFSFCASQNPPFPEKVVVSDQIKLRRFGILTPIDFRKALASMIKELEKY